MGSKLVASAKKPANEEFLDHTARSLADTPIVEPSAVKLAVAQLYGRGIPRRTIARALFRQIIPNSTARTDEQWLSAARQKLRTWEMSQDFRDLVYRHAVIALDMSTPQILLGVGKKAKRGRVDAARLALELTGRHTPKGDQIVSNVTVQIANVPRPSDHS